MKMTWKKAETKRSRTPIVLDPTLPFDANDDKLHKISDIQDEEKTSSSDSLRLVESFQTEGNKLAEGGKYGEALGKWEAALILMPEKAVLHEQKAQVLLEMGDAWGAIKAATRATELDPSWAEAWVTLARAQLNFGEPDVSIESFDRALALKPHAKEAEIDRKTALHLVKRRKHLHISGMSITENRYKVGDKVGPP